MESISLKAGRQVRVGRGLYSHYGVFMGWYCGTAWVIAAGTPLNAGAIGWVTLAEFVGSGHLEIVFHERSFPPEVVLERARSRVGEDRYCILTNNCEHFANWCVTGSAESPQAQFWGLLAVGASLLLMAKAA